MGKFGNQVDLLIVEQGCRDTVEKPELVDLENNLKFEF